MRFEKPVSELADHSTNQPGTNTPPASATRTPAQAVDPSVSRYIGKRRATILSLQDQASPSRQTLLVECACSGRAVLVGADLGLLDEWFSFLLGLLEKRFSLRLDLLD